MVEIVHLQTKMDQMCDLFFIFMRVMDAVEMLLITDGQLPERQHRLKVEKTKHSGKMSVSCTATEEAE